MEVFLYQVQSGFNLVVCFGRLCFGDFIGDGLCVFALGGDPSLLGWFDCKQELANSRRFVNLSIEGTQRKEPACLRSAGGRCELLVSR